CRQGWRTLPVSKYICNLQGSFTPGSPAIGFHKSLDTTFLFLLYRILPGLFLLFSYSFLIFTCIDSLGRPPNDEIFCRSSAILLGAVFI
ncbi:hypothetical protein, partial [[Clostridium] symbiosum]|uniref:hypothetical protein n=1 Tax=Clostridium symbiosum TaxID=1512 RepID=UPI001A9ACFBD